MKKRKRILLLAVGALIIFGLGYIIFLSHEPPEPTYEGKPLTVWLTGYTPGQYQAGHIPDWQASDHAIKEMGTNCLPRLLRMLRRHDSTLKIKLRGLLEWQHVFHLPFLDSGQDFAAYHAMRTLGPTASPALPQLIHIYETDSSAFAQQGIPAIIGAIGPVAHPAIPLLLRAATHTNEIVRNNAINALGLVRAEPEKVIPALTKCLNDSDILVQSQAIRALGHFGTNAQSAVPVLLEMLRQETTNPPGKTWSDVGTSVSSSWNNSSSMRFGNTTSPPFSTVLRDALKAIDPTLSQKAGIK